MTIPTLGPTLRDPVGLALRCPELAELAQRSPALRRAIERGRPLDAYRALFWASKMGRFGKQSDVAVQLLSQRRIFVKALGRAPVMFTLNGVGTRLYGRSDIDVQDGTYVATLFLVFLFVPVFPFASYLVRGSQDRPGKAWTFLAKVPLATETHFWQRVGALGLIALIGFGLVRALSGYRNNTLYVANGFDRALTVEVSGSRPLSIDAQSEQGIFTTVGSHRLVVRDGARVVEETTVDVPRGHVTAVWNVLGAAPVVVTPIVYASPSGGTQSGEAPEILCGKELFTRGDIDYAFTEPPKSIPSSTSGGSTVKWYLLLSPGGAPACIAYLWEQGDAVSAGRLGMTVARALVVPAAALDGVMQAALREVPAAEAEAFAKELLSHDDSVEAHRIYQDALLHAGQRDRAMREYDARLAARPSADAEYLALRVKPYEEERTRMDAVVARYPSHPFLLRAQLFVHASALDFEGVVAAAERLRAVKPESWRELLDWHVEALVALARGPEARGLVPSSFGERGPRAPDNRHTDILAFRVAHRVALDSGTGAAEPSMADPDGDGWSPAYARASAGLSIGPAEYDRLKDDEMKIALVIASDARSAPGDAVARAKKASARSLTLLPASVTTLLLGEAARVEDAEAVEKLGRPFGKRVVGAIAAYVHSGQLDDSVLDLPLELQAALHLVRSRVSLLSPKERSDCLAWARKADVFKGPVTVAIGGWTS